MDKLKQFTENKEDIIGDIIRIYKCDRDEAERIYDRQRGHYGEMLIADGKIKPPIE